MQLHSADLAPSLSGTDLPGGHSPTASEEFEKSLDLIKLYEEQTGHAPEPLVPAYAHKTLGLIERANQHRRARNVYGGVSLGSHRFYQLNRYLGGLDEGIHLIGGESSIGKSSCMRMMAWDIIRNVQENPKVHVRFYTLDDAESYFFSCMVAQAANVPINAVDKPTAWLARPENGFYTRELYEQQVARGHAQYQDFLDGRWLDRFSFVGTDTLQLASWDGIRRDIRQVREQLSGDTKLVCCFDNFHDIEIEGCNDDNFKTERVAVEAGVLCKEVDGIFLGTVELRKNHQRRPILDDIYGSRKWKYKARSVMLAYSEIGVQKPNPRIYFTRNDRSPGELCSVLELHVLKSKGSDFKGRLFYEQMTENGTMVEVPHDKAKEYASYIS